MPTDEEQFKYECWAIVQELDPEDIADAIGDIIYVLLGTAAKLGIDIGLVLDEIATSNESKYNDKGDLVKIEGKIQKGPNFKAPDLSFTKTPIDFESFLKEPAKE